MPFAKILNGAVVSYPYTWQEFSADNNNTNFGVNFTDENMLSLFPHTSIASQGYALASPTPTPPPTFISSSQNAPIEAQPIFVNGVLTQQWNQPVSFIPQNLTAFQAKLGLSNAGLYATVNSYINTSGTEAEQIAWQVQQTYNRQDPMLIDVMTAIGQTGSQIDSLFVTAAALKP